jgi:hypothetical protein
MLMNINTRHAVDQRLGPDDGIAIGPILFIIAVLGILASAIAAGSGSFSSSTTNESNRAKAMAMIDIGQNLKLGFDRILGNGIDLADVIINPANTSDDEDLFSPTGGGIAAPSVTMAEDPSSQTWHYPLIVIPKLGTATAGSRVAVLEVTEDVCDEINLKANAIAVGTADTQGADHGNFLAAGPLDATLWGAANQGKMTGCVENTNVTAGSTGFFFYQVLGIQ